MLKLKNDFEHKVKINQKWIKLERKLFILKSLVLSYRISAIFACFRSFCYCLVLSDISLEK